MTYIGGENAGIWWLLLFLSAIVAFSHVSAFPSGYSEDTQQMKSSVINNLSKSVNNLNLMIETIQRQPIDDRERRRRGKQKRGNCYYRKVLPQQNSPYNNNDNNDLGFDLTDLQNPDELNENFEMYMQEPRSVDKYEPWTAQDNPGMNDVPGGEQYPTNDIIYYEDQDPSAQTPILVNDNDGYIGATIGDEQEENDYMNDQPDKTKYITNGGRNQNTNQGTKYHRRKKINYQQKRKRPKCREYSDEDLKPVDLPEVNMEFSWEEDGATEDSFDNDYGRNDRRLTKNGYNNRRKQKCSCAEENRPCSFNNVKNIQYDSSGCSCPRQARPAKCQCETHCQCKYNVPCGYNFKRKFRCLSDGKTMQMY